MDAFVQLTLYALPRNIPASGHAIPSRGADGFPLPYSAQHWRRWNGRRV